MMNSSETILKPQFSTLLRTITSGVTEQQVRDWVIIHIILL